jgi:hypothetical protein
MTETLNERTKTPRTPYWTVERVDDIVKRLRSKYPDDAEDTDEVSALLEYRRMLRQQQPGDSTEDLVQAATRKIRDAITAQHEAICQFAVENGVSPTEIVGCHQAEGTVYRFWLERLDEKDQEKVAFLRRELDNATRELEVLRQVNERNTEGAWQSMEDLKAECERLQEALEFYRDADYRGTGFWDGISQPGILLDDGKTARKALATEAESEG